jgi:hypothetical protein
MLDMMARDLVDPWLIPDPYAPADVQSPRAQLGVYKRLLAAYQGENHRPDGEPYGFKDFKGDELVADPHDKHISETRDDIARDGTYTGNLYAYKVLIVNGLGQPRSYYKGAAGVWRAGWRDAECIVGNDGSAETAKMLHDESPNALPSRCSCGFHCWYELPPNWESPRLNARTSVPVVVHVSGDMLYAPRGVRAQHVKVVAIIDAGNDNDAERKESGRMYPTRAELAEHFADVPILAPGDVELWAAVEGLKPAVEHLQDCLREDVEA